MNMALPAAGMNIAMKYVSDQAAFAHGPVSVNWQMPKTPTKGSATIEARINFSAAVPYNERNGERAGVRMSRNMGQANSENSRALRFGVACCCNVILPDP